jgi:hypothetical protein
MENAFTEREDVIDWLIPFTSVDFQKDKQEKDNKIL